MNTAGVMKLAATHGKRPGCVVRVNDPPYLSRLIRSRHDSQEWKQALWMNLLFSLEVEEHLLD